MPQARRQDRHVVDAERAGAIAAVAFYRKWGFEVVGEHLFMLGDDPQRDLLMRRVT